MTRKEAAPLSDDDSYHGGIDYEELAQRGLSADTVVDFSSNILPFEPSPLVQAAIRQVRLDRYPDRECRELRRAIAELQSIDERRILIGNGCSELIHLIASTLIRAGDHVLIVGPTFSEYRRATRFASATIHECRATADDEFAIPLNLIDSKLDSRLLNVVWICNPNNPTGKSIDAGRIRRWADSHPCTWFVIDESYIDFASSAASVVRESIPNLVVLRSMTKSMALAGLRLGFLVATESIIARVRQRQVPWSVNSLAQAAGIAAVTDWEFYAAALSRLRNVKERFLSDLVTMGFRPVPSDTNYFLLPIQNPSAVRAHLLARGILVRDCASFGIDDHLRIAVRDPADNQRFLRELRKVIC